MNSQGVVSSQADDVSVSSHSVLSGYTNKLHELRVQLDAAQSSRFSALIGTVGFLAVMGVLLGVPFRLPVGLIALPLFAGAWFSRRYIRQGKIWNRLSHLYEFYERGIARLTGAWQGMGEYGWEFARAHHLYQTDLNVLGRGSLFELLCTSRSEAGAERLASYLLDPVDLEETKLRQESVKELVNAANLREETACLGEYRFQDCSAQALQAWLDLPVLAIPRIVALILLISSSTSLLLGIGVLVKLLLWAQCAAPLIALLAVQLSIAGVLLKRTRPRLQQLRLLTHSFTVLHQGLNLLQLQEFHSAKLSGIIQRIRSQKASAHVLRLKKLIRAFDQREKPLFFYLSFLLAVGTQLVLSVERWRAEHREDLKLWVDAWAEFEALQAIACYAYEQPRNTFPVFVDGRAAFAAKDLGHPLIAANICVGNDVSLDQQSRFYLVTGSNMAGKSTLLRAIGLNAAIAFAGGPVRASSARLSNLTICASIALADSLTDAKSRFLAEVTRLGDMLSCTRAGKPVLFLIDEVLSGTNSTDRIKAAEAVVKNLLEGNAIGALSTHDLALAGIVEVSALGGRLVHMESHNPNDPLDFDYRVEPGILSRSNALEILCMIGIS